MAEKILATCVTVVLACCVITYFSDEDVPDWWKITVIVPFLLSLAIAFGDTIYLIWR